MLFFRCSKYHCSSSVFCLFLKCNQGLHQKGKTMHFYLQVEILKHLFYQELGKAQEKLKREKLKIHFNSYSPVLRSLWRVKGHHPDTLLESRPETLLKVEVHSGPCMSLWPMVRCRPPEALSQQMQIPPFPISSPFVLAFCIMFISISLDSSHHVYFRNSSSHC